MYTTVQYRYTYVYNIYLLTEEKKLHLELAIKAITSIYNKRIRSTISDQNWR